MAWRKKYVDELDVARLISFKRKWRLSTNGWNDLRQLFLCSSWSVEHNKLVPFEFNGVSAPQLACAKTMSRAEVKYAEQCGFVASADGVAASVALQTSLAGELWTCHRAGWLTAKSKFPDFGLVRKGSVGI